MLGAPNAFAALKFWRRPGGDIRQLAATQPEILFALPFDLAFVSVNSCLGHFHSPSYRSRPTSPPRRGVRREKNSIMKYSDLCELCASLCASVVKKRLLLWLR